MKMCRCLWEKHLFMDGTKLEFEPSYYWPVSPISPNRPAAGANAMFFTQPKCFVFFQFQNQFQNIKKNSNLNFVSVSCEEGKFFYYYYFGTGNLKFISLFQINFCNKIY